MQKFKIMSDKLKMKILKQLKNKNPIWIYPETFKLFLKN